MEAFCTADSSIMYGTEIKGKSLDEWVQLCHKYNCDKNGWKFNPLKKGAYGYDNLCYSIFYAAFDVIVMGKSVSLHMCSTRIHAAWVKNYVYWRDNHPEERTDVKYYAPYNKLGDDRRNNLVKLSFDELPKEEQDKDTIIAEFCLNHILGDIPLPDIN
jgi:hypothetical protein